MTDEDRQWLELFEAVSLRDVERMARSGTVLAEARTPARPALQAYAIIAGAAGMIAQGEPGRASEFLNRELERLPAELRGETVMLALRGYATQAGVAAR